VWNRYAVLFEEGLSWPAASPDLNFAIMFVGVIEGYVVRKIPQLRNRILSFHQRSEPFLQKL
jgi:hypothetical protein